VGNRVSLILMDGKTQSSTFEHILCLMATGTASHFEAAPGGLLGRASRWARYRGVCCRPGRLPTGLAAFLPTDLELSILQFF